MTISFIQKTDGNVPSAQSVTSSALNMTTGNSVMVCYAGWENESGNAVIDTVTDTAGNTYLKAVGEYRESQSADERAEIWYSLNITGNASNQVTITFSNYVGSIHYAVSEYSSTASLSLEATNFETINASPLTSGEVTTTGDNLLLLSAHSATSSTDFGESTNWESLTSNKASVYEFTEYGIFPDAGTYDTDVFVSNPSPTINVIAAFTDGGEPEPENPTVLGIISIQGVQSITL